MKVMTFAEKVRNLLKAHRLSQSDLAEALGTSQPQVSRWLEGGTPPRSDYLLKMARTLGVSVDYLIDDEQDEPPQPPELSDDERFVLQLYRDLRLTRVEAARGLAAMARPALHQDPQPQPQPQGGSAWLPGAVRDLSAIDPARRRDRERGRGPGRGASKREPDGQDEGTDPEHSPGRVR
jgi:transcriptional regulator with XRE-family HTH domain